MDIEGSIFNDWETNINEHIETNYIRWVFIDVWYFKVVFQICTALKYFW